MAQRRGRVSADLVGDRRGCLAVLTEGKARVSLRDLLVALAEEGVQNGLGADDWLVGDERRVAEVGADGGDFAEDVAEFVGRALLAELRDEVRDHAARDLVEEHTGVDLDVALESGVLLAHCREVVGQVSESLEVELRVAPVPPNVATIDSVGCDVLP